MRQVIGIHECAAKLGIQEGDVIVQVPTPLTADALEAYANGDDSYGLTDEEEEEGALPNG